MPRRQLLTWSPQFRSASSARAASNANTGISGDSAVSMFAFFYTNSVPTTQLICSMGSSAGSQAGLQLRVLGVTAVDVNISVIGSIPVSGLQNLVGRWASVCVTKAAGATSYTIYVDGVAINGGGAGAGNFTNSPLYIGSDQTPTAAFNGNICCVGIWPQALSAAQVLAQHKSPYAPQGTPKVFYRATEGSGTTLVDISGNANNGTLTGTTWDGGQVPYGIRAPLEIQSPNDILSPLYYLDSRYGVTNDGSGKAVGWLDQSPNAITFAQSTSASRPAIVPSGMNGLQVLGFTSAGDEFMTGTTNFIGGAKEHSLFCVLRGTGSGPLAYVGFLTLGSGSSGENTSTIGIDSSNKFWWGGAGDGTPTISTTIANATSYVLCKGSKFSRTDGFLNGTKVIQDTAQLATLAITPATAALIGQYVTGGVGADYYLAVACAWNRRLGDGEWRALNNWANRVWGVGGSVTRSKPSFRIVIGDSPIRNWSFEYQPSFTAATNVQARWIDGTAAGTLTDPGYGWAILGLTGSAEARFDTSTAATGSGSMKLSTTNTGSLITVSNLITTTQPSTSCVAKPSTAYTCTFKMKTNYVSGDSADGASIAFVERNSAGTALVTNTSTKVKTTTDWTEYTVSFTTNAATSWIAPRLQVTGSTGTATLIMDAWFDDIRVTSSVCNRAQIS